MLSQAERTFSWSVAIFFRAVACFVLTCAFNAAVWSHTVIFCVAVLLAFGALYDRVSLLGVLDNDRSVVDVLDFFGINVVWATFKVDKES